MSGPGPTAWTGLEAVGPERIRELEPNAPGSVALWSPADRDRRLPGGGAGDRATRSGPRAAEIHLGRAVTGLTERRAGVVADDEPRRDPGRPGHRLCRSPGRPGRRDERPMRTVGPADRPVPGRLLHAQAGGPIARQPAALPGARPALPVPRGPLHAADRRRGLGRPECRPGLRPGGLPADATSTCATWPGRSPTVDSSGSPAGHLRTGLAEMWRDCRSGPSPPSSSATCPISGPDHLVVGPSGVRAQALAIDGTLVDDFRLGGSRRLLHVHNAPSPAPPHRWRSGGSSPSGRSSGSSCPEAGGKSMGMTGPVRWGILGTGGITAKLLAGRRRREATSVVAVGSRTQARAAAFAAEHGIPRAHGSYDDLLEDPLVEAVYISLPNALHHPWTMRSLAAGKHVLCEKPYTRQPARGRRGVRPRRAGRARPVRGVHVAASSAGRRLVELLPRARDAPDDPVDVQLRPRRSDRRPARADLDGGSLMDVGCYCVSGARLLAGEEPDLVVRVPRPPGRPGSTSGSTGSSTSRAGSVADVHVRVHGATHRGLEAIGIGRLGPARRPVARPTGDRSSMMGSRPRSRPADPYQLELDDLSAAIRGRTTVLGRADALGQARTIEALYRSARHRAAGPALIGSDDRRPQPAALSRSSRRVRSRGRARANRASASSSSRLQARTRIDASKTAIAALALRPWPRTSRRRRGPAGRRRRCRGRWPGRSRCFRRRRRGARVDLDRPGELGEDPLRRRDRLLEFRDPASRMANSSPP